MGFGAKPHTAEGSSAATVGSTLQPITGDSGAILVNMDAFGGARDGGKAEQSLVLPKATDTEQRVNGGQGAQIKRRAPRAAEAAGTGEKSGRANNAARRNLAGSFSVSAPNSANSKLRPTAPRDQPTRSADGDGGRGGKRRKQQHHRVLSVAQ